MGNYNCVIRSIFYFHHNIVRRFLSQFFKNKIRQKQTNDKKNLILLQGDIIIFSYQGDIILSSYLIILTDQ